MSSGEPTPLKAQEDEDFFKRAVQRFPGKVAKEMGSVLPHKALDPGNDVLMPGQASPRRPACVPIVQRKAQNPGPNGKRIVDAKGPAAMVNHGMVNRSASGFISARLCLKNSSHGARREPGRLSKRSGELTVRT